MRSKLSLACDVKQETVVHFRIARAFTMATVFDLDFGRASVSMSSVVAAQGTAPAAPIRNEEFYETFFPPRNSCGCAIVRARAFGNCFPKA
jgi:hypothetical protein